MQQWPRRQAERQQRQYRRHVFAVRSPSPRALARLWFRSRLGGARFPLSISTRLPGHCLLCGMSLKQMGPRDQSGRSRVKERALSCRKSKMMRPSSSFFSGCGGFWLAGPAWPVSAAQNNKRIVHTPLNKSRSRNLLLRHTLAARLTLANGARRVCIQARCQIAVEALGRGRSTREATW